MLSIEVKINGVLIGLANVVNQIDVDEKGKHLYKVKYYSFGPQEYKFDFQVRHNREEGAEKLIFEVYKKIDKIKNKIK